MTLPDSDEDRWREIAGETDIPDAARPRLLELLAADGGTTLRAVAAEFGISLWTARMWLEKLRAEGAARTEGSGRSARWQLAVPEPLEREDRRGSHAVLGLGELVLELLPGLRVRVRVGESFGDAHQDLVLGEDRPQDGLLARRDLKVFLVVKGTARDGVELCCPVESHEPVLPLTVLIVSGDAPPGKAVAS